MLPTAKDELRYVTRLSSEEVVSTVQSSPPNGTATASWDAETVVPKRPQLTSCFLLADGTWLRPANRGMVHAQAETGNRGATSFKTTLLCRVQQVLRTCCTGYDTTGQDMYSKTYLVPNAYTYN